MTTTDIQRLGAGEVARAAQGGASATPLPVSAPGNDTTKLMGETVAVYKENRCITCTDPERDMIEATYLANGGCAAPIAAMLDRSLDEEHRRKTGKGRTNARAIVRHFDNNHCPAHAMTVAAALRAHTNSIGVDRETYMGSTMDLTVFASIGLQHHAQLFMEGKMPPLDWKTWKMFADVMLKIQALTTEDDGANMERMGEMTAVMLTNIKAIATPEQFNDFMRLMQAQPEFNGFKLRTEQQERQLREELRAELMNEFAALTAGEDAEVDDAVVVG